MVASIQLSFQLGCRGAAPHVARSNAASRQSERQPAMASSFLGGHSVTAVLHAQARVPAGRCGPRRLVVVAEAKGTGVGGIDAPRGLYTSTTPLEQGDKASVGQRMAYICQDCGYVYNQEMPFEQQPDDTYQCPVCNAPKARFKVENATTEEVLDETQGKPE